MALFRSFLLTLLLKAVSYSTPHWNERNFVSNKRPKSCQQPYFSKQEIEQLFRCVPEIWFCPAVSSNVLSSPLEPERTKWGCSERLWWSQRGDSGAKVFQGLDMVPLPRATAKTTQNHSPYLWHSHSFLKQYFEFYQSCAATATKAASINL